MTPDYELQTENFEESIYFMCCSFQLSTSLLSAENPSGLMNLNFFVLQIWWKYANRQQTFEVRFRIWEI